MEGFPDLMVTEMPQLTFRCDKMTTPLDLATPCDVVFEDRIYPKVESCHIIALFCGPFCLLVFYLVVARDRRTDAVPVVIIGLVAFFFTVVKDFCRLLRLCPQQAGKLTW